MKATKLLIAFFAILGLAGALVSTGSRTASAATACVDKVYKLNAESTCVRYIQQMLNGQTNYNGQDPYSASPLAGQPKLSVDGVFGSKTNDRVKKLQKWQGLTVDGIVGKKTWNKLCSVTADAYYEIGASINVTAYKAGKSAGCY
jgi:peptidoglycan hydrolase-like protein with peptidoglycan-binding domain